MNLAAPMVSALVSAKAAMGWAVRATPVLAMTLCTSAFRVMRLRYGTWHIATLTRFSMMVACLCQTAIPAASKLLQVTTHRLAWNHILAARVADIPEYEQMFVASFDHIESADDIAMVDVVNALAAFIGTEFRNFDSPFDKFLAGDTTAMTDPQLRGMELFFGDVGCSGCHSGSLLSDQQFHAIGLPQFGPGRPPSFDPLPRDVGRMAISHDLDDAYRFKTPFLRNVALTGPYGHNGAMPTLRDMVRHHANPVESRRTWTKDMAGLPKAEWLQDADFKILDEAVEMARQETTLDIGLPDISEDEISDIVAFLNALTGETAQNLPMGVPASVPSGLPVD